MEEPAENDALGLLADDVYDRLDDIWPTYASMVKVAKGSRLTLTLELQDRGNGIEASIVVALNARAKAPKRVAAIEAGKLVLGD